MSIEPAPLNSVAQQRRATGLAVAGVGLGMLALAFAAVPLYRLFCQVTGFGGTPLVATAAPAALGTRQVTVRFDANVMGGPQALGWRFQAPSSVKVTTGEEHLIFFTAVNRGAEASTGTATFNVTPLKAAPYFQKIACFCFTEQTLAPGETMSMPVSFFVDPAIETDVNMRDVTTITLSYSMYRAADQAKLAAATPN
jgi:cytochrome c oxidase assembly protein subunit 11